MPSNAKRAPEGVNRKALSYYTPYFTSAAGFSFATNLLVLASPLYSNQLFDRVLNSGHTDTLIFLTVITGFALIIMSWIDALRSSLLARIGTQLERQVAHRLIEAGINRAGIGETSAGQSLRDLAHVRNFVGGPAIGPMFDAPWTPMFVLALFALHPVLGATALGSAIILFCLAFANEKMLRQSSVDANRCQNNAQRQAEAAIRDAETVRALGMMPALVKRWRREHEAGLIAQEKSADLSAIISGTSKFIRTFVQILIMAVGAYLVLNGTLTSGGMIAASMLLSRALSPVEQAISFWRQFLAAREALASVNAALCNLSENVVAMELQSPTGAVEVERVTFRAPDVRAPIVSSLTLNIAAGEALGVVGSSGCGKSTFCRLLVGILPYEEGAIRLDGAELTQWRREVLGRHLGYVPQAVKLFPGTVAENIARMGDIDPEQVIAAAHVAGVHEFIVHLPFGYDTPVGDGGIPLSGGQKQRIGLARAVFGNPAIVVLDEPNASLDAEGEASLMAAIRRLKAKGTTVIVVAHRLQILADMDRIMVMRDGELSFIGPRAEVLTRLAAKRIATATTPLNKETAHVVNA